MPFKQSHFWYYRDALKKTHCNILFFNHLKFFYKLDLPLRCEII